MSHKRFEQREIGGMGMEPIYLPKSVKARARIVATAIQKAGGTIYQITEQGDWRRSDQGRWRTLGLFQKAIVLFLDFLTAKDIDVWMEDMRRYRESCFRDGDNLFPQGKARCPICHKNGDSALIATNQSVMMEYAQRVMRTGIQEEQAPDLPTPPPHTRPQK